MQPLVRPGVLAVLALLVAQSADARPRRRSAPSSKLSGQLIGERRALNPPFTMHHISDLWDSSIYSIAQDALGFLWFGSHTGIGRWDGTEFDVFRADPDDPTGLNNGFVTDLAISPAGELWVGTGEGGLNKFDATTSHFEHFVHRDDDPTSIAANGISALAFDADGMLWVAMSDGHLDRVDPTTGRATHMLTPDALGSPAVDLVFDANGQLYLATFADGLAVYDPKQRTIETHTFDPAIPTSLGSNALSRLLVQGDDLWIATRDRGLDRFDTKTKRFVHYRTDSPDDRRITHDTVLDLLLDRDGVVWAGTEVGFNRIDDDGVLRVIRRKDDPELVSFPRWVGVIFQDRAGTYWFGGPATGLSTLTQQQLRFKSFRPDASQYQHFAEDRRGRLWTGSYEHGLYRVDRRAGTLERYEALRTPDGVVPMTRAIASMHADAQGFIWAGVEGTGLLRIDPATDRAVLYTTAEPPAGPGAARIEWITSQPDGTLWLATWGGGLVKMDRDTERFTAWTNDPYDENPLPATHIYSAALDPSSADTIWLATERAGLIRADTDAKQYVQYLNDADDPTSIGHDSVASLYFDADGRALWVGTYGAGLDRLDLGSGVFEHIREAQGLEAINIYGIAPEDDRTLWLSTERGLAVVDKAAKRVERTFTRADGLLSNEFFYNGAYRASTGELFFTNQEGVNYFDPKKLELDPVTFPVAVIGLQLFDQPMDLPTAPWRTSALQLGYTESVMSIEFAALGRPPEQDALYRYRIDGLQEQWIETRRDFVTLSNLGGGDYAFRLQAADSAGRFQDDTEVRLAIHQDPPPWKSWWAYTIYGALVLAALAVYTRIQSWRLEQLRRQNRLEAVERDLELTGAVQTGFLPRTPLYEGSALRLRGFYRPADVCSGDWWYHASTGRGAYNVLVGDVTGHGPGPAMVTAAAATAFRVHEQENREDVTAMLSAINRQVLAVSGGEYQMTMTVVQLDESSGTFRSYSAGGLPAIRIPKAGGRAKLYPCRGTPLGTEEFQVGMVDGELEPGDRLFLFTDGLPELNLPNDKMLGMRGFTRILEKSREHDLVGAVEQIITEADALRGENTQDDDWTFAILEWNGSTLTVN